MDPTPVVSNSISHSLAAVVADADAIERRFTAATAEEAELEQQVAAAADVLEQTGDEMDRNMEELSAGEGLSDCSS